MLFSHFNAYLVVFGLHLKFSQWELKSIMCLPWTRLKLHKTMKVCHMGQPILQSNWLTGSTEETLKLHYSYTKPGHLGSPSLLSDWLTGSPTGQDKTQAGGQARLELTNCTTNVVSPQLESFHKSVYWKWFSQAIMFDSLKVRWPYITK